MKIVQNHSKLNLVMNYIIILLKKISACLCTELFFFFLSSKLRSRPNFEHTLSCHLDRNCLKLSVPLNDLTVKFEVTNALGFFTFLLQILMSPQVRLSKLEVKCHCRTDGFCKNGENNFGGKFKFIPFLNKPVCNKY